MWYYQQGGPTTDEDDSFSLDDSQDQDSLSLDDDNQPDYQGQYDDLTSKFNDLQDHYNELQNKFEQAYGKMNEDSTFQTLMGSFDEDEAMGKDAPPSDGEPINWISLNNDVNTYKAHKDDVTAVANTKAVAASNAGFGNSISAKESGGSYTATNPHSSATGKYQFLWSQWGDSIKNATGVKSQQEFLHNPSAQEKFYKTYERTYLMPHVNQLKQQFHPNLSDDQLARLVHFRGPDGAAKYLQGKLPNKPESYNSSISDYIKQRGGIARTKAQQRIGLNNNKYDQMYFPNAGYNTFRGLDNGQPVHLQDQRGKYVVLNGPDDTEDLFGNVFETK